MSKKVVRVRRPCVPDDFEEELTQEECDMIDKFYPMYEEADVAAEAEGKMKCVCGSMIMPKGMKSHEKSKKHLDALRTIQPQGEDLTFKDEAVEE